MFLLVDCNNFFVSCERVFNPTLDNKPVVILSNNDGCAIARSNEAKALNIPMGAVYFKYKEYFQAHSVVALSSNFALYSDMSARIFAILRGFGLSTEVYSVDEAFLYAPEINLEELAKQIESRIKQWVGIPVSIGIAPTKTLAKAATHIAKQKKQPFHIIQVIEEVENFPVEEIWGIGRKTSKFLKSRGINYAQELVKKPKDWIKKHLKVTGLKTVLELAGNSCIKLEDNRDVQKTIMHSRSFKKPLLSLNAIDKHFALFVNEAFAKLRKQGLLCGYITVFMTTNRFNKQGFLYLSDGHQFQEKIDYPPIALKTVKIIINHLFTSNQNYKRLGVVLSDFSVKTSAQKDLFSQSTDKTLLLETVDSINKKLGKHTVHFSNLPKRCKTQHKYTSDWNDIIKIII